MRIAIALIACGLLGDLQPACAADITLLAARVLRPILTEVSPDIEALTGDKLVIIYDTAGGVTRRIAAGERADAAITQKPDIVALAGQGRIEPSSIVPIARSGVAVGVPKGAAKIDIASVSAFKAALLAARSIAYPDPAIGNASGVLFRRVIEKLGVRAEVDAKAKVWQMPFVEWAADNTADLAITQPTDILGAPSFELVGWLPDELQDYDAFTWTAGITVKASNADAARAVIKMLSAPAAAQIINRRGMKSTAHMRLPSSISLQSGPAQARAAELRR